MAKKIIALSLLFVFIITSGFGCKTTSKAVQDSMQPITLTYWRVWDGPDDFAEIISQYNALHPFITINYRKLRYDEYENELLNAFAEDRGPDIFSINNTWMKKYQGKLAPLPAQISMVYPVTKGSIKKEVVPELRTTKSLTLKELKDNFVDVVYSDVVMENKIYGLPLALDTLALYYNRDLLNNAGLTNVPQYWNREFQQVVKKLTKQDLKGNILQSGAALGGSGSIERFSDILSLLMIQNGATMLSDTGQVSFNQAPTNAAAGYNPGAAALRFYTDFANPVKEVYSWNNDLKNSVDAFTSGNLAMMFGYAYHLPTIKARAPKLNFGVAKMPQIEGAVAPTNFANYWVEVVSKKSAHINESWDFVQFMTKAEQAQTYLTKTKRPTALRSLVTAQREDQEIGVFADQVLTAKSWYRGKNVTAAEQAIADMIDSAVGNETKLGEIMNLAVGRIQQTINP
ncbi:MAG TPA: extracellular solute-binding protein [bacterium]|nr:extracellular solute-binding protein [bacterium]HPT29787.1 extracellular solute-binding protein [bacterium]